MRSENVEAQLKSTFLRHYIEAAPRAGCEGVMGPAGHLQNVNKYEVLASVLTFSLIIRQPGCTAILPVWNTFLHGSKVT